MLFWAVIKALKLASTESHPEHVSNLRKFANNYDWSGLKSPVAIKDIEKFENKNNILVNVLKVEGKDIHTCRKGQKTHKWSLIIRAIKKLICY